MSPFGSQSTAEEVTAGIDLTGKTWLITGVNSGLGRESARVLAKRGAHIIGLSRTAAKATATFAELGIEGTAVACELGDLDSVRAAAAQVGDRQLDGIMANAGIMALPSLQQLRGVERQLAVNHIGHFVLVNALVPNLAADGRVVILSSGAHRMADQGLELDNTDGTKDYHPWRMYGRSKLANIHFARSLARRFAAEGSARTANSLHPGVIRTGLARHIDDAETMFAGMKNVMKTVEQGAATQCYVAVHPSLAGVSGLYFSDCAPKEPNAPGLNDAQSDAQGDALWAWTETQI